MEGQELERTRELIARDLDWEETGRVGTEEELVTLLARHLGQMIDHQPERLFSLMYRLDVSERKVGAALAPAAGQDPAEALARLVVDRQKRRLATRQKYKQDDLGEAGW